ncbi:glycosyltransferase family 2 protein [Amycolatopsis taiwanensis]|uniref:Glycosyl transferase n=1 Tax=Amycolatopsis taiwanensis TaxID=342230 RepID=A0A9W6VDY8_9PSEU|nr:glycosyltransferase [Amycolatopsis taiwanensis]GLY67868.1 glycosyl transferase [Amycolatopsis taiwanensis]
MTGTTVVIATRNRAGELARTLRELTSLRPAPAIVVVDNASADHTSAVAGSFPDVRLIRLRRNLAAAARNVGVAEATTPYVAFSDDDSWWAEGALAEAERILDAYPDVGLLAARTLVGPPGTDDPVNASMAASPLGRARELPGPSVLGFLGCAVVVRKVAFVQAGGFSELLHFGAEERLLALDLAAHDWKLCYAGEVHAHHHPSPNRPAPTWRARAEWRNNLLITWLRRPMRRCLAQTTALAVRAVRDADARTVLVGLLARLPPALRQRRRLPEFVEQQARRLERAEEARDRVKPRFAEEQA